MTVQLGIRAVALIALCLVTPTAGLAQSIVGVLGIEREIAPIEKALQDSREIAVRGYVFRLGTLNGRQVVAGRSGVGKVNAAIIATLLIGQFNPSAILFSGTAGAIDPALHPGDVVIGGTMVQHDVGLHTSDGIKRRGVRNAVTGDVFLSDMALREDLQSTLKATAVEMEGAAVVQTCRQFRVSCLVVRGITDRADTHALTNYEQFLVTASQNAATLVSAIIARLDDRAR